MDEKTHRLARMKKKSDGAREIAGSFRRAWWLEQRLVGWQTSISNEI